MRTDYHGSALSVARHQRRQGNDLDLRRQLAVLRAWLWLVVVAVVLAGGSAFAVSSALPKSYEARVQLLVGQSLTSSNPDINQVLASQRLSQTYASIATTRPLAQKVVDQLGLPMSADELLSKVTADAPANTSLVIVTVTDTDAGRAAGIANAVAAVLVAASPTVAGTTAEAQKAVNDDLEKTRTAIASTENRIDQVLAGGSLTSDQEQYVSALQSRLATLRETYATLISYSGNNSSNQLSVIDPAVPPAAPASPRPLMNTALAAMLGLLAAVGFIFLIEYLDDTVKNPDELTAIAELPTLAALPIVDGDGKHRDLYRLVTLLYPKSAASEAYRTLRTNIQFASVDRTVRTVLVTSATPEEGKTMTAANLAIAFAQAGQSVLLVDCDMRNPSIHRLFDLPNETGISALFRRQDNVQELLRQSEQPNLWILTAGPVPPNPSELLGSRRMATLLSKFTDIAETVVIDSPPLQAVADAAILASKVDGVVVVVAAGKTRRTAIRHGLDALQRSGGTVLGVALNRMKRGADSDGYAYHHYYHPEEPAPAPRPNSRKRREARAPLTADASVELARK